MRRFYASTKEILGPTRSSVRRLKDVNGTNTITDTQGILDRRKTHFENLLNYHSSTLVDFPRKTPQHSV